MLACGYISLPLESTFLVWIFEDGFLNTFGARHVVRALIVENISILPYGVPIRVSIRVYIVQVGKDVGRRPRPGQHNPRFRKTRTS
jgi:hypothetical protein